MSSAQGEVQHMGYVASFPSLINVSGEPTYIMVLKDSAGLVKLYALVNVENFGIVATGNTQTEAKEEYLKLLKQNGVIDTPSEDNEQQIQSTAEATIEIADIKVYTVGGESIFYITATDGQIYKQRLCDDERLIVLKKDDKINVKYKVSGEGSTLVREITFFSLIIDETTKQPARTE